MKGMKHGPTFAGAYGDVPEAAMPEVDATCEASIVCTGAPIGVSSDDGRFYPFYALNHWDDRETTPPVRLCEDCGNWLDEVYTSRGV